METLRVYGAALRPMSAWQILQGVETLPLRMERHCSNALAVAEFLRGHPQVSWVNYPGLADHPQHALVQRQMRAFDGIPGARGCWPSASGWTGRRREVHRVGALHEPSGQHRRHPHADDPPGIDHAPPARATSSSSPPACGPTWCGSRSGSNISTTSCGTSTRPWRPRPRPEGAAVPRPVAMTFASVQRPARPGGCACAVAVGPGAGRLRHAGRPRRATAGCPAGDARRRHRLHRQAGLVGAPLRRRGRPSAGGRGRLPDPARRRHARSTPPSRCRWCWRWSSRNPAASAAAPSCCTGTASAVTAWDGRETAPAAADERLFLGADGQPMPFAHAVVGGRAVGVPGAVRMLEAAHRATRQAALGAAVPAGDHAGRAGLSGRRAAACAADGRRRRCAPTARPRPISSSPTAARRGRPAPAQPGAGRGAAPHRQRGQRGLAHRPGGRGHRAPRARPRMPTRAG